MFGTFAPEGPTACSGARESVVYGCSLPLPTSSALQVTDALKLNSSIQLLHHHAVLP